MDNVKTAYAWQEAIELSKQLVTVCEEFRDPEADVLVGHLRQAIVDIPAGIAADLQAGRAANMEPMVKLATTVELVKRIYPAIETSGAEEQFEALWQRMSAGKFDEREPEPEAEDTAETADEDGLAETAESPTSSKPEKLTKVKIDGVSQSEAAEVASATDDSSKGQE